MSRNRDKILFYFIRLLLTAVGARRYFFARFRRLSIYTMQYENIIIEIYFYYRIPNFFFFFINHRLYFSAVKSTSITLNCLSETRARSDIGSSKMYLNNYCRTSSSSIILFEIYKHALCCFFFHQNLWRFINIRNKCWTYSCFKPCIDQMFKCCSI